jgi:hypothetical protein
MTLNESTRQEVKDSPVVEKSKLLKSLVNALDYLSVAGFIVGMLNFVFAKATNFSSDRVADLIFNIVAPLLFFICSRILARGKVLSIWIMGGCILLSIVYGFAAGRSVGFGIAILGAVLVSQLLTLKKRGELS